MYQIPIERRVRPCRFRNLNQVERAVICNGCGGKGGWLDPPDYKFRASCDHHDFNYWLGGSLEDRKRADEQFLEAMLEDAVGPWWKRLWLKGAAWRYYWAVRAFGWKFFNLRPPETDAAIWDRLERAMTAEGYDVEARYDS